jgi:hypothetical protein
MNRFPNPSVAAADIHVKTRPPARRRRSVHRHSDDHDDETGTSDGGTDTDTDSEEENETETENDVDNQDGDRKRVEARYRDRNSSKGRGYERKRKTRRDGGGGGGSSHLDGKCVAVSTFCDGHRRYLQFGRGLPILVDSPVHYHISDYSDCGYVASFMLTSERTLTTPPLTFPERFVSNPFVLSPDGTLRTGPTLLAYDRSDGGAHRRADAMIPPSSLEFMETRRTQLLVVPELHNVRWAPKPSTDRQTFYLETCSTPPPPSPPPSKHRGLRKSSRSSHMPTDANRIAHSSALDGAHSDTLLSTGSFGGHEDVDSNKAAQTRSRSRRRVATAKHTKAGKAEKKEGKTKKKTGTRTTSAERHVLRKWKAIGEPDPDSVWVVTSTQQATYAIALIIGIIICAALWHYPRRTVYHHIPPPPPPPQPHPPSSSLR